jgi:hypothetical protein
LAIYLGFDELKDTWKTKEEDFGPSVNVDEYKDEVDKLKKEVENLKGDKEEKKGKK